MKIVLVLGTNMYNRYIHTTYQYMKYINIIIIAYLRQQNASISIVASIYIGTMASTSKCDKARAPARAPAPQSNPRKQPHLDTGNQRHRQKISSNTPAPAMKHQHQKPKHRIGLKHRNQHHHHHHEYSTSSQAQAPARAPESTTTTHTNNNNNTCTGKKRVREPCIVAFFILLLL